MTLQQIIEEADLTPEPWRGPGSSIAGWLCISVGDQAGMNRMIGKMRETALELSGIRETPKSKDTIVTATDLEMLETAIEDDAKVVKSDHGLLLVFRGHKYQRAECKAGR